MDKSTPFWRVFKNHFTNDKERIFYTKYGRIILATTVVSCGATVFMALFAYCSLQEVQRQREITFKQFAIANRPSIAVTIVEKGLRANENIGFIDWKMKNAGGDVQDLEYRCILFKMIRDKSNPSNYNVETIFSSSSSEKFQSKQTGMIHNTEIKDKKILLIINSLINRYDRINYLGFYLRVDYTVPPELSVDGNKKLEFRDALLVWDHDDKKFEMMKTELFRNIYVQIVESGALNKFGGKQISTNY